jgi:hypothetical protein
MTGQWNLPLDLLCMSLNVTEKKEFDIRCSLSHLHESDSVRFHSLFIPTFPIPRSPHMNNTRVTTLPANVYQKAAL